MYFTSNSCGGVACSLAKRLLPLFLCPKVTTGPGDLGALVKRWGISPAMDVPLDVSSPGEYEAATESVMAPLLSLCCTRDRDVVIAEY